MTVAIATSHDQADHRAQETPKLAQGQSAGYVPAPGFAGREQRPVTVASGALSGGPPLSTNRTDWSADSQLSPRAVLRRSASGPRPDRDGPSRPVGGISSVIRRTVTGQSAITALSNIMTEHECQKWYQDNWPLGVKAITDPIAAADDTTKDNLKSKLLSNPAVAAAVRGHRMSLDGAGGAGLEQKAEGKTVAGLTGAALKGALTTVWQTYTSLLFYHVSKAAPEVRKNGLDPLFGGTETGKAATDSLGGKKEHNVSGSKNKVFLTRKWSEVKGYQATGGEVLRILIPTAIQPKLVVDPDSQYGLYLEGETRVFQGVPIPITLVKGVDRANRRLGPDAYYILTTAIADPEIRDLLPELYQFLLDAGMFEPGKEEQVLDLTSPPFGKVVGAD